MPTNLAYAYLAKNAPSFATETPGYRAGARGRGVAYERKAQKELQRRWGDFYLPSPWIVWADHSGQPSWAQPDGLLFDFRRGRITIIEIKLRHTTESYWQLRYLYLPLVEKIFPPQAHWKIFTLEMCRWYDSKVIYPGHHRLCPEPSHLQLHEVGVLIWRP